VFDKGSVRRVPSPGPRPYSDDLANCFFGRDPEIGMILDRVYGQRLSVLIAESASGKTSLLQAGLMPVLRESRLVELAAGNSEVPLFPLLLNQWLGRANAARDSDFVRLLASEADRHLKSCAVWYERRPQGDGSLVEATRLDREAIAKARSALRGAAVHLGLAVVDTTRDELVPLPVNSLSRDDDRVMVRNLLEVLTSLTNAFGTILLILDQFEEVLGDPLIGRQAIVAVEAIFDNRRKDVTQFLSLRNDSIHLLEPLEKKSILEGKRRVSITKLDPQAVDSIVEQMSEVAQLSWLDAADRRRLIGTFTNPGPGVDVNLLGLQVVLEGLFSRLIKGNAKEVSLGDIKTYCMDLVAKRGIMSDEDLVLWLDRHPDNTDPLEIRNGELAEVAPRKWIDRCLKPAFDDGSGEAPPQEPDDVLAGQIGPMVMRMADWLVTPAGFKRPMTLGELEHVAFRADILARRMAGVAIVKQWDRSDLERALKHTCKAALDRLVRGHVLKTRGGSTDTTYELVHDQFGRPLRNWASLFRKSPLADLGAPYEIADRTFEWAGVLKDSLQEHSLQAVAWVGCTIRKVDFSDLNLESCDFRRTVFDKCIFNQTHFFKHTDLVEKCRLEGAIFEGCELKQGTFDSCTLDSMLLSGGTLEDVVFRDSSMEDLKLVNCRLEGSIRFERCALDGATIGADHGVDGSVHSILGGDIAFIECGLAGAEFKNLRFENEHSSLEFRRGVARGALFESIVVARSNSNSPRCVFDSVILTGAVFLGCELRDTEFLGESTSTSTEWVTSAAMLVFRDIDSDETPVPTILDGVSFQDVDLENFSFLRCLITGPISFQHCRLSGGTIMGSEAGGSSGVKADIVFRDRCDLAALEFNTLDMTGYTLEVLDSSAPGLYFENVTVAPGGGIRHSARFIQTSMPGALFLGCHIHGARFEGASNKKSSLETLVLRGVEKLPASMGDCVFEHVNMDNFTFERCTIDGPVDFFNSSLSGGTFGHRRPDDKGKPLPPAMQINGNLTFKDGCDLSAIEVTNAHLVDAARLIFRDSDCPGALFSDVDFAGAASAAEPALLMDNVDLRGAVFVGCTFGRASFLGAVDDSADLKPARGLVFRGNRLGSIIFRHYDCDGGFFEDLIDTQVVFDDCSLLRAKLSGIGDSGHGGMLDVRRADLLYAEIEQTLLDCTTPTEWGAPATGGALVILAKQLEAARSAADGRKYLRLLGRKR
jgi:uncharacterized protein YjbI with pentapeptide repeats